jgi:hypothetical protein
MQDPYKDYKYLLQLPEIISRGIFNQKGDTMM